jgi:hypothetical protein
MGITKYRCGIVFLTKDDRTTTDLVIHMAHTGNSPFYCYTGISYLNVEKIVHSSRRNISEGVLGRKTLDLGGQCGRGEVAILGDEVGGDTSDVRGSHGGTRDGVGSGVGAADPGRDDGATGAEDVDDRAVVGVGGTGIGDSAGTNGDGRGGTGGGGVRGIDVGVTGSDDDMDASGGQGSNGAVEGGGGRTTEGHGDDRGTTGSLGLGGDPVETGDANKDVSPWTKTG